MPLIRLHNGWPHGFCIKTKPKFRPLVTKCKVQYQLKVVIASFPTCQLALIVLALL